MSYACTPILVGVASPVSEIKLALKFGQIFPFGLWTTESQMFIAQVLLENIIESCVFDHTGTTRKHSPT